MKVKVAVTEGTFIDDDPYQSILWFEFDDTNKAIDFVKEMLNQKKVSHIFISDEGESNNG